MDLPIRTERLMLRALTAADLDEHWRLMRDPSVVRYLYEEPLDRDAAAEHLEGRLVAVLPAEGEWLNVAVERDGDYLGEVGVCLRSVAHRQCEVGYMFLPDASRNGYATEATAAMVELAFTELGAHRVVGRLDARNDASALVLERLGMRRESHLRENEFVKGEWTDEIGYAITEDEWRTRQASGAEGVDGRISARAFRESEGVDDWYARPGSAHAVFRTGTFARGVALVDAIGALAEAADHHPDVDLRYSDVTVRLTTHDVGGLSERDVELARQISAAARELGVSTGFD